MKPWIKTVSSMLFITPAILGLSIASVYAEEEKRIEIIVEKENDSEALVEVLVNGNSEAFVLPELADGEARTIVTEAGNSITATKSGNKTTLDIDGEEVVIMAPHHNMGANFSFISDDELHPMDDNKILVIGGNLSEEVRAALQNTLSSYVADKELVFPEAESGTEKHFMFIDGDIEIETEVDGELGGLHKEIKIIKKHIEKTEQ